MILTLPEETAHFPEPPGEGQAPQLLGLFHDGVFSNFVIETFHLHTQPGFQRTPPSEHRHDVFHAVLYVAGEGNFHRGGTCFPAPAGTLVLTSPGEPHSFAPATPVDTAYHELTFSLKHQGRQTALPFDALFAAYFGGGRQFLGFPPLLPRRELDALEEKYFALERALRHPRDYFPVYQQAAALLESLYVNSHGETPTTELNQPPPGVELVRGLLERNLGKPLRLGQLAAQAGMSPEHLCREFKRHHGCGPLHYRLRLRVSSAERMLRYSDRPLKEIAADLGFPDVYYFSKAFKKFNGDPPATYRRGQ